VFSHVCEALREDDLARLRSWMDQQVHRARFTTWLVTVVRHLTVDWFRKRDGRRRLSLEAERLPPLRRRIFELVFLDRRGQVEAYALHRTGEAPALSFPEFLRELRATYAAATRSRRGALLRGTVPSVEVDEREVAAAEVSEQPWELRERLQQALATLSDHDRVVVQLYVVESLAAADVARMLRLPNPKAVYNQAYRALELLREHLERAGIRREDL
jgi:RNA polymerase sigma factor (sigma-70 family)